MKSTSTFVKLIFIGPESDHCLPLSLTDWLTHSLSLVGILLLMFCRGYEVESWSRFWTRFWILSLVEMLMFAWNFEVDAWSRFWRWNLIKICVSILDMTSRYYFGKMNSILGSVVPLAMFPEVLWNPASLEPNRGRSWTRTLSLLWCFQHPSICFGWWISFAE